MCMTYVDVSGGLLQMRTQQQPVVFKRAPTLRLDEFGQREAVGRHRRHAQRYAG
jgi:hypothetical protein